MNNKKMKNNHVAESDIESQSLNLQAIWHSVQRHWRGACLFVLLSVSIASIYTAMKAPVYKVGSSVLIENRSQSIVGNAESGMDLSREVTEAQRILAGTRPVLQRALEIYKEKRPNDKELKDDSAATLFYPLDTSIEGQLLVLSCYNTDPGRATDLSISWMEAFVEEMSMRERSTSLYTSKFLDEQVPKLQKKWYDEQIDLQNYLVKTKYDPKEFEHHPLRERYAHFSDLLTTAQARLIALHDEAETLKKAVNDPEQIMQSPRARKDANILGYQKMIQEQQKKLLEMQARYLDDAELVKKTEAPLRELEQLNRKALINLGAQIQVEYAMAEDEVKGLKKYYDESKADVEELNLKAAEYQRKQFSVEIAKRQYEEMQVRLNNANVAGQVRYSYAKPWERGEIPDKPYSPSWPKNLLVGFVIGMALGSAFIYLKEVSDQTVHSDTQLKDRLGINVIGSVPLFNYDMMTNPYQLVRSNPHSLATDKLRSVQMTLLLSCPTPKGKIIVISSAAQSEGKSTIASNLAVLFAEQGRKTLLIDGDLYKGSLSKVWGTSGAGITSLLSAPLESGKLVCPTPIKGLHFISMGKQTTNHTRVWESDAIDALFKDLRNEFDVTIIDSPPLVVPDSQILAQKCDAMLVVVRSRVTEYLSVRLSIEALQRTNCPNIFFIVNGLDAADAAAAGHTHSEGYEYSYGYGYKEAKAATDDAQTSRGVGSGTVSKIKKSVV